MTEQLNDLIVAGEPYIVAFVFKIDPNTPVDISAYSALIEMRRISQNGELVDSWSDADSEVSRDNLAGTVALTLPPSFTSAMSDAITYIDCLLTGSTTGARSPTVRLKLVRGVTR